MITFSNHESHSTKSSFPEPILLQVTLNKQKWMQSLYKLIKEFTSGVGIDQ